MTRRRDEDLLQRAVAAYLALALRPPVMWTAIQPERRGPIEGARMKAKGVRAGFADIIVLWPRDCRGFIGDDPAGYVLLELKAIKGVLSKPQRELQAALIENYAVVRSVPDVERALRAHGIPLAASVGA